MAITLDKATMREIRSSAAAKLATVEAEATSLRQQALVQLERAQRKEEQVARLRQWLTALDADLAEE